MDIIGSERFQEGFDNATGFPLPHYIGIRSAGVGLKARVGDCPILAEA